MRTAQGITRIQRMKVKGNNAAFLFRQVTGLPTNVCFGGLSGGGYHR